jgi:hypothetical protein
LHCAPSDNIFAQFAINMALRTYFPLFLLTVEAHGCLAIIALKKDIRRLVRWVPGRGYEKCDNPSCRYKNFPMSLKGIYTCQNANCNGTFSVKEDKPVVDSDDRSYRLIAIENFLRGSVHDS